MRKTQMAGRSVFNVYAGGFNCPVVVTDAFSSVQSLPFTTTAPGDTRPFTSAGPITIHAGGSCTTEVRADNDGRLIQRDEGPSYTMNVPAGSYWLSNTTGCTVSVS
jgi:hypothetical protein